MPGRPSYDLSNSIRIAADKENRQEIKKKKKKDKAKAPELLTQKWPLRSNST